jgi:hypothetical protein
MNMSGTPNSAATNASQTIIGAFKNGAMGNFGALVTELTEDGIGLADQEAQDFDNFVDQLTEKVEAGESPSQAWSELWAPYASQAKSDLWTAAMGALGQAVSVFDSFVKGLEAIL